VKRVDLGTREVGEFKAGIASEVILKNPLNEPATVSGGLSGYVVLPAKPVTATAQIRNSIDRCGAIR